MKKFIILSSLNTVKYQLYAAITANLVLIGYGSGIGWLSPALPILQSNKSPLNSGPVTVDEISWIGSIASLGALSGNILTGLLVIAFGSKHSTMFLAIPQLCSWFLLAFGREVYYLYICQFLIGFVGGGALVCVPLYVAKIADNNIRGRLGSFVHFSRNTGILLAYFLGFEIGYIKSSIVFCVITIAFCGAFLCLPSTPQYMLRKQRIEKAEDAFKFYKGYNSENNLNIDMTQFDLIKTVAEEVQIDSKITMNDLWNARNGFVQAIIIPLLSVLSGSYVFLTYGTKIIENSGTLLSGSAATIPLALAALAGTALTPQLVDTKGRKFLMILSLAGCALGLAAMISYLYIHHNGVDTTMFHWTPVVCITWVVFIGSAGVAALTSICLVEAFPVKVRFVGVTFGNVLLSLYCFAATKCFPILIEAIGLSNCLIILCIGCAIGIFYVVFFVDETNGKELNVIEVTTENSKVDNV